MGFDSDGNTFYLLDDNRLYRRDAPIIPEDEKPAAPRKKFRGKKRKRGARRIESEEPESPAPDTNGHVEPDEDSTWHVVCVTMDDWNEFLAKLKRSRDLDEKALYRHLNDNVMPTLIEEEKEREKQRLIREQEYLKEQAFAARKRSSRLVQKEEYKKLSVEREAELAKLRAEEEERKKEQLKIKKLEQEREARLLLREQRQRERELRIQQREEEKRRALEEAERAGTPIKITIKTSMSPTPVKKTARQEALDSQKAEVEPPKQEESWFFDCICGQHGTNYDDGTYTVACEKCDIWQHVACLPDAKDREELLLRKDAPEGQYPDYEFICSRCRKKAKEAQKAEAVMTKEQLRKEKERAANRAKYERRKAREKARKEEERRQREEDQRLGITRLPDGTVIQTPIADRPPTGVDSSSPATPMSPDDRIQTSTMPMAAAAPYPHAQQMPRPIPANAVSANPSPYGGTSVHSGTPPYYLPYGGQMHARSPPKQPLPNQPVSPPQYSGPLQAQNPPPPQIPRPQYPHMPYQTQQHFPQPQAQRSMPHAPVQSGVPPYWSPYTTSPNLPGGQRFQSNPPPPSPQQSPQYTNGTSTPSTGPRHIAIKPSPNHPFRPNPPGAPTSSASQTQYTPPLPPPQARSSQSPAAIQPRPSKSPELVRKSPQSTNSVQRPEYPLAPKPSANVTTNPPILGHAQRIPSPLQSKAAIVSTEKSEMVPTKVSQPTQAPQVGVIAPPMQASPQSEALNGIVQPDITAKDVSAQVKGEENIKPAVMNGLSMHAKREESNDNEAVKEKERTKMSFILN